jgi:anion-transporting  ArsA/GET3 family ATPase
VSGEGSPLRVALAGKRVCICAGAGGVGKTTIAAATAIGLAAEGRRVAVVTIDPAPRLASALGLSELDSEPRRVDPRPLERAGIVLDGELWAMMLDPKRAFDELITRLAPDALAREHVLSNRIYRELSSAIAGSQEFGAVAKLYELHRVGAFDVIVLDTPPSRNALDFLDAPGRLGHFFGGAGLRVLLGSGKLARRAFGLWPLRTALSRLTGIDLLEEITLLLAALEGMVGGFSERAAGVAELLRDPATTFILVSSPEREPIRETVAFAERLAASEMALGVAIVNRMHLDAFGQPQRAAVREELAPLLGAPLAQRVEECLRDATALAQRDADAVAELAEALPQTPLTLVPQLSDGVNDLAAIGRLSRRLLPDAGDPPHEP